jgi:hypothetical protein
MTAMYKAARDSFGIWICARDSVLEGSLCLHDSCASREKRKEA